MVRACTMFDIFPTDAKNGHQFRQRLKKMEEEGYLQLLKNVAKTGEITPGRNGATRTLFGIQLQFSLTDGKLPLLTTRFLSFKNIYLELLWFISGCTNANELSKKGVKIWDRNATPEFLRSRGLNYPPGELGPVYGHQWRHWNAEWPLKEYGSIGIDQLQDVIDEIKKDPYSRRHIVTAWNPGQIDQMALPPCHMAFQFNATDTHLDCMVTQRSADVPLGLPYNIASYALLTHMIAKLTGKTARKLVMSIGNAHIYENQLPFVTKQLQQTIFAPPTIEIDDVASIDEFSETSIRLQNYQHGGKIDYPFTA
jgi:thymidylate synthase